MDTTPTPVDADYAAAAYTKGRKAAEERAPLHKNPYSAGSPAFHGWNDGHYDERSARARAVEGQRALIASDAMAT